ncbi:hypothetical protein RchiOBHm_Chr2g0171521 [Rosa chinensis]|uniref:Uncharacterized protein n=1 Tax=Rosa chinensis TaxID=74649 RepID=A0A2P6S5C3_ROSCH|nr:hypothetical protein RchiOBHm_Chr2g0171521 [Rosa chinensis]
MLFPFNFPVLGLKRFFSNRTGGLLRSRRLWWSISGGVAYLDLLYHSPMPTVVWIYLVVHADVSKDLQICKTLLVGRKQICPSPARALRLPLGY